MYSKANGSKTPEKKWTMSEDVISLPTNPHSLSSSLSLCSYTIVKINFIWLADKKYGVLTCQTRFFTVAQDKILSDTEHNNSAVYSKSTPMWLQSCNSVYSRNTITSLLQKGGRERLPQFLKQTERSDPFHYMYSGVWPSIMFTLTLIVHAKSKSSHWRHTLSFQTSFRYIMC
jgi:hypothetical protein